MLVFPNCKINLGLHVTKKRPDGYHDIETVFYPINWCDALEVIENKMTGAPRFSWSQSGIPISGDIEENLIYKAWKLICDLRDLPPLSVHLHKVLPMGAGLGGGSSDAAHFINLLNTKFDLNMSDSTRSGLASQLGSDCAFFIHNHPVFAEGRGELFSPLSVDLSRYYILLVYPGIHSNTREAYEGLTPQAPKHDLRTTLSTEPVSAWKQQLVNDFEPSIFKKYPEIKELKERLYAEGAVYTSLSGSGSSVFGIFDREPVINLPHSCLSFVQKPTTTLL